MKLCVIFHRLGPYHVARLGAAAQKADLCALEMTENDATYAWDKVRGPLPFRRLTLVKNLDTHAPSRRRLPELMRRALTREAPEAVAIPGWSHPGALAALDWCAENGVPALLMSESQAADSARHWWKEGLKRRLLRSFSAALVGGLRHAQYLASLGMGWDKIFRGYDVVDNRHFMLEAALVRRREADLRMLAGLPKRYFLASSRFVPQKNLPLLIRAYARYRRAKGPAALPLVIMGDGPLKGDMLVMRHRLGLQGHLQLPGFVQYYQLPLYYGLATAFVHASRSEPWGLVVNEAMASGLPLLLSRRCGCAADLLREGVNGHGFEPDDEAGLAQGLAKLGGGTRHDLEAMGRASQQIVQAWSPSTFAESLHMAASAAMGERRRPGGRGFLRAFAYGRSVMAAS